MGWKGFFGTVARHAARQAAAQRRAERASMRRRRELLTQAKAAARAHEQQQAAHQVALYENYIEVLTSVHKESWGLFHWHQIASNPPPPPPPPQLGHHEQAARRAADAYQPSITERLFGTEHTRRDELAGAIARARQQDQADHQAAMEQHRAALDLWQWFRNVAQGVLAGDAAAYCAVIEHLSPFEDLQELGTTVSLTDAHADVVSFDCTVQDEQIVPSEELRLSTAGKLVTKEMPKARYWALYQDHVCGCAIRVARDGFALLPVRRVVVNVTTPMLDRSTGHVRPTPILAVSFQRDVLDGLQIDTCDPSEAMKNFDHRMSFKKASGFEPVEPTDTTEGWMRAQSTRKRR